MTVKTTKINNMPCIISGDILVFDPNSGLKNYTNTLSGSFTYPAGDKPCSIMINKGVDIYSYACHAWLDFPECVIYRYKDGAFGIKKCKTTTDIPNRQNVLWAVGGMGLLNMYNPKEEGFARFTKNGKTYDYSDVLRKTNHTVLGIKDNQCYLIYVANKTGAEVNSYCKSIGLEMAIMLDGGHIAGINGSESYAKINTSTKQGYAIQAIGGTFNQSELPPKQSDSPVQPSNPTINTTVRHTVKKGESLSKIAKLYGVSYKDIAKDNNIKAPLYIIRVGQVLTIKK